MKCFDIIVACDKQNGIGKDNTIPWKLREDMKYFAEVTTTVKNSNKQNAVIMGRKTWESISERFRPLKERVNIVLTRNENYPLPEGVISFNNLESALKYCWTEFKTIETTFIIGGAEVYRQAIENHLKNLRRLYVTHLQKDFECDTFFPLIPRNFQQIKSGKEFNNGEFNFTFRQYGHQTDEYKYLYLLENILNNGEHRSSRAGDTISLPFQTLQFDISNGRIPLLTTKRVFWRGVVEELLWFISGSTDVNILKDKGVHIWDGNTTREFLDSRGLTEYREGDMGPTYSFNFRHFGHGIHYTGCDSDYEGKGFDQIAYLGDQLKNNPHGRRHIISLWDPASFDKVVLPPCAMMYQFYVRENKYLDLHMHIRSNDLPVGNPFNIASGTLFTNMLAHLCGYQPGRLSVFMGDCHIYKEHVEGVKEQLSRVPLAFPTLKINRKVETIGDFKFEDFEIVDYFPHPSIKYEMSV